MVAPAAEQVGVGPFLLRRRPRCGSRRAPAGGGVGVTPSSANPIPPSQAAVTISAPGVPPHCAAVPTNTNGRALSSLASRPRSRSSSSHGLFPAASAFAPKLALMLTASNRPSTIWREGILSSPVAGAGATIQAYTRPDVNRWSTAADATGGNPFLNAVPDRSLETRAVGPLSQRTMDQLVVN